MNKNIFLILSLLISIQLFALTTEIIDLEINNIKYSIAVQSRETSDYLIVFIHGLCCTKESFENAFKSPELKNYSLLSIDLPGCGDSSRSENYSYSMEEQAKVISAVIDHFIGRYNHLCIVGHSMGGALGVLIAEKFCYLLSAFVNVEGNLVSDHCHLSRKAANVSYEEFKSSLFKELCLNLAQSKDKALNLWLSWINKSTADCFYKSSCSLVKLSDDPSLLKKYLSIFARKIYFKGENSYNYDVKIPGVLPITCFDSGHFIMFDEGELFYKTLRVFIEQTKINIRLYN